jgi:hypothetical protein
MALSSNAIRERLRRTFLGQIGYVSEKGQLKSTRSRRLSVKSLMKVEEAWRVCKDRSKWKEEISAYLNKKQALTYVHTYKSLTL